MTDVYETIWSYHVTIDERLSIPRRCYLCDFYLFFIIVIVIISLIYFHVNTQIKMNSCFP